MAEINYWRPSKFSTLIDQCYTMGAIALALAGNASDEKREQYLLLAAQWAELAEEMQCVQSGSQRNTQ